MLNRIGNKRKIADIIIKYFPTHETYIEPFFGIGGIFFKKPKAKYNILNDIDDDIYNFFWVLLNRKEELIEMIKTYPKHQKLLEYFKNNKQEDPVKKAFRFLYLSNYGFLCAKTLKVNLVDNYVDSALEDLDFVVKKLQGCTFLNKDFRDFFKSIAVRKESDLLNTFVYCDPPYLNTSQKYKNIFKKNDFLDLLDILNSKKWKFAISEFYNDFVINEAKKRNLKIIELVDRYAIKTSKQEILIINYEPELSVFDKINYCSLTKINN